MFRMLNCKPAATPMATGIKLSKYDEGSYVDPTLYKRLVGSLMYLTTTRPNIMFVVSLMMRRALNKLLHKQNDATQIVCDNKSAIALSRNHIFHRQSKHIDTRYHFVQELVSGKEIFVQFCRSKEQFADTFTKPLGNELFKTH